MPHGHSGVLVFKDGPEYSQALMIYLGVLSTRVLAYYTWGPPVLTIEQ